MNANRFFLVLLCWSCVAAAAQNPDNLKKQIFPGIEITTVETVTDSVFRAPNGSMLSSLPPFVRVAFVARPVVRSNIRVEVWMPVDGWNGRFLGTGNGGGAGNIAYGSLAAGLKRGFAVANTDMGTSPGADSIVNYPERWQDFGHRATHEMTVHAKRIITCYYDRQPAYSYFSGCSTGGQQALMEAWRYPDDYDGIIAGAPANNRTHLHVGFLWNYILTNKAPDRTFTKEQLNRLTDEVLRQNRGKDGGAPGDRFLTDPRMAEFDYDCDCLDGVLSREQRDVLRAVMQGPVNPETGEAIYTAFPPGSENIESGLLNYQNLSSARSLFYQFYWLWGLDADLPSFDFNRDVERMDSMLAPMLNANNPNLEPFETRGGKLLMYTGTADPLVPFQDAVNYYERVVASQGSLEKTQSFFRYFLIPGMAHCGGGPGVNDFGQSLPHRSLPDEECDILAALMSWVEKGRAPEKFTATHSENGKVIFSRPVFPYPEFPHYTGGDPSLPSSYKAVVHERGKVTVPAVRYDR